eukprot:TRINITY_DN50425_c0_g1_i1.p1 TRINITY_DN50425_c0_g1~~TRINITY_DN50425_c0_g1_i1.p1  ORF type:complete len:944 (+),score=215.53 TRINITY_DN50425_c0_g1_i1:85-2916(+)
MRPSAAAAVVGAILPLAAGQPTAVAKGGFQLINATGLRTNESGGEASFTIRAIAAPQQPVTVPVVSSNTAEGVVVGSGQAVFDGTVLEVAVVLRGVDDLVDDGDIAYQVMLGPSSSADPAFDSLALPSVPVVNGDDDTAGIVVTRSGGGALRTVESGGENGSVAFSVRLLSVPTHPVVLPVWASDPAEAVAAPGSLQFSAAESALQWRNVTLTGVRDWIDDGDRRYTLVAGPAVSADPKYNGSFGSPAWAVVSVDVDTAAVQISPGELRTTEAEGPEHTAAFTVVLATRPTAPVTVALSSGDASEGMLSLGGTSAAPTPGLALLFTDSTWNSTRTVQVTGQHDSVDDGDARYAVGCTLRSADPVYGSLGCPPVNITNVDDDTAGVTVEVEGPSNARGMATSESGAAAVFAVVLNTQPVGEVTLELSSTDPTEGTVAPSSLVFLPGACSQSPCAAGRAHWSSPQRVSVTGVDDDVADGPQVFSVNVTVAAATGDPKYSAVPTQLLPAENADDDTAGLRLQPLSAEWAVRATGGTPAATPPLWGGVTTEDGGAVLLGLRLLSRPVGTVSVNVSSNDTSEGTVNASRLLNFTGADWQVDRVLAVTGEDDAAGDCDVVYQIAAVVAAAGSQDPGYNANTTAPPLLMLNVDNDRTPSSCLPGEGDDDGSLMWVLVLAVLLCVACVLLLFALLHVFGRGRVDAATSTDAGPTKTDLWSPAYPAESAVVSPRRLLAPAPPPPPSPRRPGGGMFSPTQPPAPPPPVLGLAAPRAAESPRSWGGSEASASVPLPPPLLAAPVSAASVRRDTAPRRQRETSRSPLLRGPSPRAVTAGLRVDSAMLSPGRPPLSCPPMLREDAPGSAPRTAAPRRTFSAGSPARPAALRPLRRARTEAAPPWRRRPVPLPSPPPPGPGAPGVWTTPPVRRPRERWRPDDPLRPLAACIPESLIK